MGKIKYLIKRIFKMDYKKLFNTVDNVSKKTKKSKISIFFDIIYCGIKYQAGYIDYELFEMYNMNDSERKTVITRGVNNQILKKYNDKNKAYIFENKSIFNTIYDKYLNRDWLYIRNNLHSFKKFIKQRKKIIVKPLSLSCGKGVEKIEVSKYNPEELYSYLCKTKRYLIEDVAEQNKIISDIYPESINTLRIVTLDKHIAAAFIRFGNNGNVVDNFNNDGLVTTINIDTGTINYPAIDKKGNVYEKHPYTNKEIIGLKIPMWNKVKKLCTEVSNITPEIGYIGWDICIGEKEPFIIEGNDFPGHDLYQLPVHRDGNIGLLPHFKEIMEEENENSNSNRSQWSKRERNNNK